MIIQNYIHKKVLIELKLIDIIYQNVQQLQTELNIILNEQDEFKLNKKLGKLKKHFPASLDIPFEKIFNFTYINKNKPLSLSLSSKNICIQVKEILDTMNRRVNMFKMLYDNDYSSVFQKHVLNLKVYSVLDIRNYITKYDKPDEIIKRFPSCVSQNGRIYFNTIYTVKTENPLQYANLTDNTFCDTILICCNGKQVNIFFELDKINPFQSKFNYKLNLPIAKKIFMDETT